MSLSFNYPEQRLDETDAQYWARVHAMGLPYRWEADKAIPPGPITVTYEWATDGDNGWWPADSEGQARRRLVADRHPQQTLHRRTRWVAVGDWEDVAHGATKR